MKSQRDITFELIRQPVVLRPPEWRMKAVYKKEEVEVDPAKFTADEMKDHKLIASWANYYRDQYRMALEACQTLDAQLEETNRQLKKNLFPKLLSIVEETVLPSQGVRDFFHSHPFTSNGSEKVCS
jgi:hypothetical protein